MGVVLTILRCFKKGKQMEMTSMSTILSIGFLLYEVQGSVSQANSGSSWTAKAFRASYCTLPLWRPQIAPWETCQDDTRQSAAYIGLSLVFGPVHQARWAHTMLQARWAHTHRESAVYIESSAKNYSWRKISKNDLPMDQKTFQSVKPECVLALFLNF